MVMPRWEEKVNGTVGVLCTRQFHQFLSPLVWYGGGCRGEPASWFMRPKYCNTPENKLPATPRSGLPERPDQILQLIDSA
jgi:hypothetical protein